MRWKNSKLSRAAGLAAFMGLAVSGSQALAHDSGEGWGEIFKRLHGDYGLTTKYSCVRTPFLPPGTPGIDRPTKQLLVGADVADAVGSGVMSFAPDGTVTVSVVGAELETAKVLPGQAPVTTGVQYGCQGTYSLKPEGRIEVSFPTCNVTSRQPGISVTVSPLELEGFIGSDRNTMVLSLLKGTVETVAVWAGGNVVQQRERMCLASFSLTEIRSRKHSK